VALQVTSPYGSNMHYADNVQSGHFAFTAAEAGDYLSCFWVADHQPPITIGFEFDWRSGVSAKDWPSVAKKGKVDVSISLCSLDSYPRFAQFATNLVVLTLLPCLIF
jgi:p24 family protein delta-1